MPKRIQRQRTKGWRMPLDTVYVGRPSRWGNPWTIGHLSPWGEHERITPHIAVLLYHYGMDTDVGRMYAQRYLRGHDLACWCPLDQPCHADVLLDLANR